MKTIMMELANGGTTPIKTVSDETAMATAKKFADENNRVYSIDGVKFAPSKEAQVKYWQKMLFAHSDNPSEEGKGMRETARRYIAELSR